MRLNFWTCFFLNSKEYFVSENVLLSKSDHDNSSFEIINVTERLFCRTPGAFSSQNDDVGHGISIALVCLIIIFGCFGGATNILNAVIINKSFAGGKSFKESLIALAWIEMLLSFSTVTFSWHILSILGNSSTFANYFIALGNNSLH